MVGRPAITRRMGESEAGGCGGRVLDRGGHQEHLPLGRDVWALRQSGCPLLRCRPGAAYGYRGRIEKVFYPVFPPDHNAGRRCRLPPELTQVARVRWISIASPRCSPTSRPTAARQVWEWAARGAPSYGEMTNLPPACARGSRSSVPFSTLELAHEATSRRRHGQGALPHARRPPARGGADALPRRPPLGLRLVAVGLPAHVHVLRDRARCSSAAT